MVKGRVRSLNLKPPGPSECCSLLGAGPCRNSLISKASLYTHILNHNPAKSQTLVTPLGVKDTKLDLKEVRLWVNKNHHTN